MPLFRRDAPSPAAESAPARPEPGRSAGRPAGRADRTGGEPPSLVTRGTVIEGTVTGNAELRIEGEVRGKVELDGRAVVGPAGVVRGEIVARTVQVAGQVFGDVRGLEQVELADTGRLEGDIAAPRVAISEGAFFKGKVEMSGQGTRAGREPRPPRTPERPEGAPGGAPAPRPEETHE